MKKVECLPVASVQVAAVTHCVHRVSLSITLRLPVHKPRGSGHGTHYQTPIKGGDAARG